MKCTSPKTVGFKADGKTISWSQKTYSKEFATFQIPCGKCLACRLENARQTAIRCVHEASTYEKNSFITLTYSEENLHSDRLQYKDFQKFVKDLRSTEFQKLLNQLFPYIPQKYQRTLWNRFPKERRDQLYEKIRTSVFVAGEYGDRRKRPHWHALVFNWRPSDVQPKYTNDRGDQVYSSETLNRLWPHGISELGQVTFESAGYCARYASKKLSHGPDGSHNFEPISKRSSRNAIGKRWIEKNWADVFTYGYIVLPDGNRTGIPRYYEKWFKKKFPDKWENYVKNVKSKIISDAIAKEEKLSLEEKKANFKRSALKGLAMKPVRTRQEARKKILESKFEQLKQYLKF